MRSSVFWTINRTNRLAAPVRISGGPGRLEAFPDSRTIGAKRPLPPSTLKELTVLIIRPALVVDSAIQVASHAQLTRAKSWALSPDRARIGESRRGGHGR